MVINQTSRYARGTKKSCASRGRGPRKSKGTKLLNGNKAPIVSLDCDTNIPVLSKKRGVR